MNKDKLINNRWGLFSPYFAWGKYGTKYYYVARNKESIRSARESAIEEGKLQNEEITD